MKICTFFGDDYFDESLLAELRETMVDLIENNDVDLFYVGEEGDFNLTVA